MHAARRFARGAGRRGSETGGACLGRGADCQCARQPLEHRRRGKRGRDEDEALHHEADQRMSRIKDAACSERPCRQDERKLAEDPFERAPRPPLVAAERPGYRQNEGKPAVQHEDRMIPYP